MICLTCYHGSSSGRCDYGYAPDQCSSYIRRYRCPGGLVYDHKVTRGECEACAASCRGCLDMAIRRGRLRATDVAHLLT